MRRILFVVATEREEVMMGVVTVAGWQVERDADRLSVVRERLEAFAGEMLGEAMNRPVQVRNGGLYLRGLIEDGSRKSLEPLVARLGEEADYQSMQQFLADSPWDPALVVKAVAERVGRCRWGGLCICRRTGVRTPSGGARRRSPRRSSSRPNRNSASSWSSALRSGMFQAHRCWVTMHTARTPGCVIA